MENALQCWEREGSEVPNRGGSPWLQPPWAVWATSPIHCTKWAGPLPRPPVDLFSFRHYHIKHANVKPS